MAKNNDWQRHVYSPEIMASDGDDDLPIDDDFIGAPDAKPSGPPAYAAGGFLGSAFPDPESDPNLFA